MIVYLYLTFVVKLYVLLSIHQIDAIDPDRELVYDGTIFAIFSASTNVFSQKNAVDNCISWRGNIASINSQEEDAQIFNLTNYTHFQCWIGLNRHQQPILSMVNPDGYVWEDGSNGTYRKFSPNISSLRYVKFRPNNGYSLNEKWKDAEIDDNTNCFLCGKTANSRGCDFTNNGSCYRTYQVDTAVNWYDAQSSCEDWGGNLASVTSEAENLLLFTRTPIIAFNCWIGMYTSVNESITWNDGNAFSYNKWKNGPSTSPPNCINWNTGGSNVWTNGNCNTKLFKCYICKRILTTVSIPGVQHETLYSDSVFGYFYVSWPGVTWNTALQECIGWGGSLASIESAAEDGTLYSLAADNDTQCWIGLEISTRGSESIIWVDGSDSSYRNYSGQTPTITSIDKYYSLRSMNGGSGGGWNALNMAETLSCFYCEKLANQRGCDFTYNGSCYRTFETNTALNWFDSQSNCVMWGGNLASITSEDENTLLFLRTPFRADDCWIGLINTNMNNGAYHWIDGEMFNYDMWASGAPNNIANTDNCARNKVTGMNEWNNYNCNSLTDSYICKRSSNAQFDPDLGELFGELINGNLGFKELKVNTILYRNVTLICGDVINPSTSSTNWIYSQNNDLSMNNTVDPTKFGSQPGITFISVNSQQGFYQCRIQKQDGISVYTVGVFDLTVTTVTVEGRTYNYTIGIDRTDILLLCVPMNNSIDFINYRWRVANTIKNNPILVSNLSSSNYVCEVFGTDILSLIVREPRLTLTFDPSVTENYTQLYPITIQFSYQGFAQNFMLSSNIDGRWKLPNGTYQAGPSVTHPYLLQQYAGLYTFYLYNWDGVEVPTFQINITTADNIGIFISTRSGIERWEVLQNNSRVFLTEQPTTIICVGPRITSIVEWFREDTLLRRSNGSNILDEGSIQTPGYYNCRVDEVSTYSIYVANKNIIVEITDFTETVNYTLGSPTLLYHSNDSVPDSQIRWTTENIETGNDRIFNLEYPNPVPLSIIFSDVGGGQHTFTCFYRNSPVTVLGSVDLNLEDTTAVTISYSGIERNFSDVDNIFFPNPQPIEIPSHTSEVVFKCNLTNCIWQINYTNNTQTVLSSLNIALFRQENEGIYSLLRTTDPGKKYTTASVNINTSPELVTSNVDDTYIIYIGIAAPIILCFSLFLIITFSIIIICLSKKRRKPKQFASRQFKNEDSDSPSKTNDVQNLNGHYSKVTKKKNYEKFDDEIVETAFTQSIESTNYQNITTLKQDDENTYEKVPENIRSLSISLDVYKMHVNELWQNEGSLENDYATLGGQAHRYSCSNGTQDLNRVKNRFKLIYPYDKSRVILKETSEEQCSDYINASYIPGLYVKETFIAAQAPKDVTLQSFWQMIAENDISNIVMLTNLVESGRIKCEAYFPVKEGKKIIIGPYEIILYKEEILIGHTIRMLSVFHNGKKKQIKQFHFTAWPDHDVPDLHNELLHFVEKVQTQKIDSKSPILVHCSAGVGRSGTFLAIYNLLAAINQGNAISIYNLVHEMREHRPQMVQTFSQYKFIYLSVLEMLLGSTSIPNDEFTATYKLYMQSESEGYVSVFFQQFSELNYQCDKGFEHTCTTALDDSNKDKNPIKTILPSDKNRAIIFSPHREGDYINATSIDDNQYIITITPTRNTLGDFLQLLHQFKPSMVVFLVTPKELRLIQDEKSDRVVYWPKQGEPLDANTFTLTSLSSEKFSSMIRNKIRLTHIIENDVSEFTQIISTKWNERGEPELGNVVMLLHAILKQKQGHPGSPIIFHCTDGAGKTGVLFTVFKAILESKEKNFIDIFHIVKKLRIERMNFVSTLNHFVSCFSLMNEYCSNAV